MKLIWVFLSLTLSTIASRDTQAALPARITKGELKIFVAPNQTAKVLVVLPEGTAFEASNYPIEGFYKVRLDDGSVGWAPMDKVTLYDPETQNVISKPSWGVKVKPSWYIRPTGGVNLLIYPGLKTNFPNDFTSMGMSIFGGLEIQYLLSSGSGFFLRGEYLMWSGTGAVSTDTYSFSSIPINLGLVLQLVDAGHFTLKLSAGGGLGLMNRFQVSEIATETVSYMNPMMIFAGIGKLEFNFEISDSFGFFLEAGGRAFFSGNNTFNSDNGTAPSFEQNFLMYGPFGGAGFLIGF
ncbi:MAG: SH3 domain-containing protein [Xanthomonadaceae bacterium]|nr:SH3 domain-containing protein [Xanthomonadaceae bacterium]